MDLVALVLLTLVGYSIGAVAGSGKRIATPQPVDLVLIVVLWVGALFSRTMVDKWAAVGIWFAIAVVIASVRTAARRRQMPLAEPGEPISNKTVFQRIWIRWKRFARHMGNFQGRVLLAFFYFIIVTPFGLLVRFLSDPLHIKRRARQSFWLERPTADVDLEKVRSQF